MCIFWDGLSWYLLKKGALSLMDEDDDVLMESSVMDLETGFLYDLV